MRHDSTELNNEVFVADRFYTPAFSRSFMREEEYNKPEHTHNRGELILALSGNITCTIEHEAIWVIPPQCALYIPVGTPHSIRASGNTKYCIIFIHPDITKQPDKCCSLSISPLVKEMILHLSDFPQDYEKNSHEWCFAELMLNELIKMPTVNINLQMPYNSKLRTIANALTDIPSDRKTAAQWAKIMGMSERTLERLIIKETGLTFRHWRQQFHIIIALQRLEEGASVQQTAWDLGYESVAAFITMFKKRLGKPPRRYFLENK